MESIDTVLEPDDYDNMPRAELLSRWLNGNEEAGHLYQERYPENPKEK